MFARSNHKNDEGRADNPTFVKSSLARRRYERTRYTSDDRNAIAMMRVRRKSLHGLVGTPMNGENAKREKRAREFEFACPRCYASIGERCQDLVRNTRQTKRVPFHRERVERAKGGKR